MVRPGSNEESESLKLKNSRTSNKIWYKKRKKGTSLREKVLITKSHRSMAGVNDFARKRRKKIYFTIYTHTPPTRGGEGEWPENGLEKKKKKIWPQTEEKEEKKNERIKINIRWKGGK